MIKQAKAAFSEIPPDVIKFLARAIILFAVWKFLYGTYFGPNQLLDNFLTNLTIKSTVIVLQAVFGTSAITIDSIDTTLIKMHGKTVVFIMNPCNALELYILYTGFILSIPTTWMRMLFFIGSGLFGIYILNILRCSALAYLNYINFSLVNVAHHYVFTVVVYSATFFSWVHYINGSRLNDFKKP